MNRLVIIACVSLLLSGCGSLFSGSAHPVFIDSVAGETQFIINNKNGVEIARGQTPTTVVLETGAGYFKNADYLVHFSKPSYKDITYRLVANGSPLYFTNIFNILGFFIDPATGAMWQLPDSLVAVLPRSK